MKPLKLILALTIFILLAPITAHSQNQDDTIITIEEIYNYMIINEVSNIRNVVSPSTNYVLTTTNNDYSIPILNSTLVKDIITDFKNEWDYIIFNKVIIKELDSNNILVTGLLSGKNIEKGMINQMTFQHTWILQNGAVIKFKQ